MRGKYDLFHDGNEMWSKRFSRKVRKLSQLTDS